MECNGGLLKETTPEERGRGMIKGKNVLMHSSKYLTQEAFTRLLPSIGVLWCVDL